MNRTMARDPITQKSPHFQSKVASVYYLLVILTGIVILFLGNKLDFLVDIIATAFYVVVTALFYALTKRV